MTDNAPGTNPPPTPAPTPVPKAAPAPATVPRTDDQAKAAAAHAEAVKASGSDPKSSKAAHIEAVKTAFDAHAKEIDQMAAHVQKGEPLTNEHMNGLKATIRGIAQALAVILQ